MVNEEFLAKVPNIQTSCCLLHAIKTYQLRLQKQDKQIMTLIKMFNRLSENYQDFICLCMQQRFTKNEMKKYEITQVCTVGELRNHSWLSGNTDYFESKKQSQCDLHNDGKVSVILSLKELLNVSSDWMDHKNSNKQNIGTAGPQGSVSTNAHSGHMGSSVPSNF